MIKTLKEYNEFIYKLDSKPGEHHFVATYLVPKIYCLTGKIPDYINPDGTKNIPGDIIYQKEEIRIEVKYNSIQFTKNQYKLWFSEKINIKDKPTHLIIYKNKMIYFFKWKPFTEKFYKNFSLSNNDSKNTNKLSEQELYEIQHYGDENQITNEILNIFIK